MFQKQSLSKSEKVVMSILYHIMELRGIHRNSSANIQFLSLYFLGCFGNMG